MNWATSSGSGEFEQALEGYQKGLNADPLNHQIYLLIADFYVKRKLLTKSLRLPKPGLPNSMQAQFTWPPMSFIPFSVLPQPERVSWKKPPKLT